MMKRRIFQILSILMLISLPMSLFIQQYYTKDFYFKHKTMKVTSYLETVEETMDELINDEVKKTQVVSTLFLEYRMIPALIVTEDNQVLNFMNNYLFTDELIEEVHNNYIDKEDLKEVLIDWSKTVDKPTYTVHKLGEQSILIVCYPSQTGEKLILIQFNQWVEEFTGIIYAFIILSNVTVFTTLLIFSFFALKKARNTMASFTNVVENTGNMKFQKLELPVEGPEEFKELQKAFNVMSDKLKQTIDELNDVNKQLENELEYKSKLEKQRKQFVSDVSHELKTPIAILQSYAEAIMDDVGDRNFYINALFDEANKMEHLVKALLELSKMESGNVKLDLEEIRVLELLNKEVKLLSPLIAEHNNNVKIGSETDLNINVDINKIGQVIRNIIINALQHGKRSSPLLINVIDSCEYVEIRFFNELEQALSEENLNNLFNRFYKVDESRKRGKSGAGLGLAIVKDIVELHGGYCKAGLKDEGIVIIVAFKKVY